MPNPRFDKTVAALVQPWFFGAQSGANYRSILTTKFNGALNKAQVEAALSLGNYFNHTEAKKQKRAGLRAVLLANFLMLSHPVSLKDQIKQKYEDLDIASLKRVFSNAFPSLQDNGNRPAWAPANFADPNTLNTLQTARSGAGPYPAVPQFRFIVHGVKRYDGDVFDTPTVLTRYEVLSMSLVAKANLHVHPSAPQGVILSVPENNILAASPTDVAVQNYAPAFDPQDPTALTITENLMDVATRTGGLKTPDFLLQNIRPYPYYNEVVVCGRAGVPLPHGVTGAMTLAGVFVATDERGVVRGDPTTRAAREARARNCAVTHHVPLVYIPSSMASPTL